MSGSTISIYFDQIEYAQYNVTKFSEIRTRKGSALSLGLALKSNESIISTDLCCRRIAG